MTEYPEMEGIDAEQKRPLDDYAGSHRSREAAWREAQPDQGDDEVEQPRREASLASQIRDLAKQWGYPAVAYELTAQALAHNPQGAVVTEQPAALRASAPIFALEVLGRPAPQGSKRHVGNGVMLEMSKYVRPWRQDVRAAAETLLARVDRTLFPLDGPLLVDMVFSVARPKGHYRTGRNAHLLRDTAPARPQGMPDLSKLTRSTEDALTSAGVWKDDARVVEYGRLAKIYADSDDPDALSAPGAVIRVRVLPALAVAS